MKNIFLCMNLTTVLLFSKLFPTYNIEIIKLSSAIYYLLFYLNIFMLSIGFPRMHHQRQDIRM